MEASPPVSLAELKRDWIEGLPRGGFQERVRRRIDRIRGERFAAHTRGVLIAECDPVRFAAAFFAAVHLRVPVILANPRWARAEWRELGGLVNPAVIFGKCPLDTAKRPRIPNPAPSTILIPTGGSGGGVKLAVHRWETLAAAWDGLSGFLGPGPLDSCCVLPLYHVSGLLQLVRSFLSGGRIAFPESGVLRVGRFPAFGPGRLCLSVVPTQLHRLLTQKRLARRLADARVVFMGGAPAGPALLQEARDWRIPLVPTYGMTETAAMVTALPPDEFLAGDASAGRPLRHAAVEVLREDGGLCAVGEAGRIRVRGRSLFRGYHGRKQPRLDEGFLTDDEGCFDRLGRLTVLGRRDRLIITGGEKVDPHEVEQAMLETGAIKEALVVGWPDAEWGRRLVAFYTLAGVRTAPAKWEDELRRELAAHKIPKWILEVPMLPLDARGKVDRGMMEALIADAGFPDTGGRGS